MNSLSADEARALMNYDPETGLFTRNVKGINQAKIGEPLGSIDSYGYIAMRVRLKLYRAHRLAWLIMTGAWPESQIDHINGHRDDNRWSNLRQVTGSENQMNRAIPKNNSSGVMGVDWHTQRGRWRARIKVNGKYKHVGLYDDINEAAEARRVAAEKYNYHENHGRKKTK